MNPRLPPLFYELDEYTFQDLCRDVFAKQPGIATCEVYGVRRQQQRGIDLLAQCSDGPEKEAGQCKCYKEIKPSQIKEASCEFLRHLDHWQKQHVRRFILFVACDLDRTQQQDIINEQIEYFAPYGIKYEAWSASTMRLRLAPYPEIVARYIKSQDLVENICGFRVSSPAESLETQAILKTVALAGSQIERLASGLSKVIAEKLEEIRENYREGCVHEAHTRLQELRRETSWEFLEKPLQARILRTLAAYALNIEEDVSRSLALADEVRSADPTADDSILRTLLRYHTEGPESALREIGDASNLDGFNLRLGLLLELGRGSDLLSALQSLPQGVVPNAETMRLHALALLVKNDLPGAQTLIQMALNERPKWQSVRIAGAIINYFSALSPVTVPDRMVPYPEPVDWAFVKRDDQSMDRLRKAKAEFEVLTMQLDRDDESRQLFEVWLVACMANDPDRQAEAQDLCRELLTKNPSNHMVLIWALARDYDTDLLTIEKSLENSIEVDKDEL